MVGSDEGEARDSASRTWAHSLRRGYDPAVRESHDLYILTRRRGADTAHTEMARPTHEAPTREYTHKHKQTHSAARRK